MSEELKQELVSTLQAALEWIDAVPATTPLPAMPGLCRDDVDALIERALTAAQPAQNERELPEPSDIGEVGLLRAELAGLNACVGHLSAMVDEQTRLVQKAAQIMKALHESATPDDGPDMDAIIPGVKFSEFVDGHAELLFALAHGPQVTTIEVHGSLTDEQIEPMFRARKATPSQGEKDAWYWYAWGVNDCERRAAQPAQAGERDTGPHVLREVFELCDDTMTKMESESTEFSRGRAFEAKGISRAIGTWFQDEFCGRSHMGEPVTQPAAQATPAQDGTRSPCEGEPMSARKAAYFMQRFKREEKLLGPNEQLAIEFVLALLDAQQATPEPRTRLTADPTDPAVQARLAEKFGDVPHPEWRDRLTVNLLRQGSGLTKNQIRALIDYTFDGIEPDPALFAKATSEPVGDQDGQIDPDCRRWLEGQRIDGGPHGFEAAGVEALSRMWRAARTSNQAEPAGEPFGYFRPLPFGWEQCSEHDEGAVALFTRPAPGVPEVESTASRNGASRQGGRSGTCMP